MNNASDCNAAGTSDPRAADISDVGVSFESRDNARRVMAVLTGTDIMELLDSPATPALLVSDTDDQVVWVNESYERLSGWSLAEIRGLHPKEFLHGPQTNTADAASLLNQSRSGNTVSGRIVNYRPDGSPFHVSVESFPLIDPGGRVIGRISVQTDVSAEHYYETQWSREHQLLQAISRIQSEFILTGDDQESFRELLDDLVTLADSDAGLVGAIRRNADETSDFQVLCFRRSGSAESADVTLGPAVETSPIHQRLSELCRRVMQSGTAVRFDRETTGQRSGPDTAERQHGVETSAENGMGIPITADGQLVAVAGLSRSGAPFQSEEADFLQPLLDTIGRFTVARRRAAERRRI
ncbi:MAG: PAS domain-containing protein, partial [Planctomycetaceae bacterium]|nr:PAS domain-containing protein [Planctomycetaceae bacterium]